MRDLTRLALLAFVLVVAVAAIGDAPPRARAGGAGSAPRALALGFDTDGLVPRSAAARRARDLALLTPTDRRADRAAGTWSGMFDPSSLSNRLPLLFWALALVAAGLIGLPYVWVATAGLPDRGAAFARPVGLLLVGWGVWWLASVQLAAFTRATIAFVAAGALAGAAAIAVIQRRELVAWIRRSWRVLAVEEAVFWVVFGAFLAVRWANPDLWHPTRGGEKPMDFAFLNAVIKSAHFPPFDPWFAGGYINYYYFGFVLVAVLAKATAIVPAVAYNLAVPTMAGLLGAAACGVTLALVAPSRGRVPNAALVSGVLAAAFVVVAGNLAEVKVAVDGLRGTIPNDWWYWNASRAISHPVDEPGPITEFPAFTYLFADLHAHAMALPFATTSLGLAVAFVRRTAARGASLLGLFLLALVVGALWPLNTWDFPTYTALAVAVLVLAAWGPAARPAGARLLGALAWVAGLAVAAYVLFLPFHTHYRSAFIGVEKWRGSRTSLEDYLTIHGFFLFLIASALVLDLLLARDLGACARAVRLLVGSGRPRRFLAAHRALVRPSLAYLACLGTAGAVVIAAVAFAAAGELVSGLIVLLLAVACLLFARRPRRGNDSATRRQRLWQVTLLFVIVGLTITLAVEWLVVSAIDVGRNNTVFKSYVQVWVLFGVAAAVSLHVVYERLRQCPVGVRVAWRSAFVALFACVLLYPALATPAKIDDRFDTSVGATLDGEAFMRRAVYVDRGVRLPLVYDLEAIRWMQEHVRGSPTIAEANTYPMLYGWGNRFAMFTGDPAVVGWDFHERQQRSVDSQAVTTRIAAVQEAYRTTSARRALDLLAPYGAEYLVVGGLERAYFPGGVLKWQLANGRLWRLVYANPGVQVYRISSRAVSSARRTSRSGTRAS